MCLVIRLNATKVTDEGIIALAKHCLKITVLDLSWGKGITCEGMMVLAQNCPNLSQVKLGDCDNISGDYLVTLPQDFPNLKNNTNPRSSTRSTL